MAVKPIDPLCERTRAWASLELDGELSELEALLFYEHVKDCSDCAAVVDDLRRIATILRAAPLVEPMRSFEFPSRQPLQGHVWRVPVRALAAAATVLALAVGLGVLGNSLGGSPSRAPEKVSPEIAFFPRSIDNELRQLRQPSLHKPRQRVGPSGRLTAFV